MTATGETGTVPPFVTVVVLNWNGRRLLPPCLEAVAQTDYLAGRWETVVVDNASTDGSAEWVEANHPWVRVRRNPRNWGFGRGNNPAMRDAPGPFVVLLNSDTRVRPGWLRALVDTMEAEPRAGAATAKLLFPDDGARRGQIQNAGGMLLSDGSGRDRGTVVDAGQVSHQPDDGRYDLREEVFFFCGASVMLRKAALDEVGYFDERYFMYYEDLDLSWRLRVHGWTVVFAPDAVVQHEHAASSGEWSPLFTYNVERNRPLMLMKLAPWRLAMTEAGRYVGELVMNVARVAYWAIRHRQRGPHASRTRMQARVVWSWLRDLPGVLRDRRAINASRLVPDAVITQWMGAVRAPGLARIRGQVARSPRTASGMRVGIYNQFLATMGGGERHMGMAAQVLAKSGFDVELITHVPVSIDRLSARFGLDLDGVTVRTTPLLPFDQLRELTAEYDLFVNASFMSCLPTMAHRSILLVLFPFPVDTTAFGRFKAWVGARLHRQLLIPRYGTGFFGPQELAGSRYRFTAGHGQVVLETPWPGRELNSRIVLGSFRPTGIAPVRVTITARAPGDLRPRDDRGAEQAPHEGEGSVALWSGDVATTPGNYQTIDARIPGHLTASGSVEITISSPVYRPFENGGDASDPDDYRELGVAVARVMVRHPRHHLYELLFERLVPELSRRLHGLPDPRAMEYLSTYDAVLPISRFTDTWLAKYWSVRGTDILYPPVDVAQFTPRASRDRIILGVGRFFQGSHNKKHDEMIRTFGELVREGVVPGWELHLVGGSMPEARHQKYLARCRALASGLPVHLHVDAPADMLTALYERATIFWHATGFGNDENRDPILFEHFGITTVEAMAAGCVPVVIGKGAQPEIVADGISGFTWTTRDAWKSRTVQVANDPALASRLRAGALMRSRDFGEDVFTAQLQEIVERFGLRASPAPSSVPNAPVVLAPQPQPGFNYASLGIPDRLDTPTTNPSPVATGEGSRFPTHPAGYPDGSLGPPLEGGSGNTGPLPSGLGE
ncbi:MAG: glycosyltransferase [Chloroflexi bacterium]|nr:glycosyltransferase [Chloroflexota bacterium]